MDVLNRRTKRLEEVDTDPNFMLKPLDSNASPLDLSQSRWINSYVAMLKIAQLERDISLNGKVRMKMLLKWTHDHFAFTQPLILMASHFFGVRRPPGIVKKIKTGDKSRLADNISNSAWDLHILTDWHIKIKSQEYCLIASRDKAAQELATKMRKVRTLGSQVERTLLSEDGPQRKDCDYVYDLLAEYGRRMDDPTRTANIGLTHEHYKNMISDFENQLGIGKKF